MSPWSSSRETSRKRNTQRLSPTFSFAAFFVSESIQLTYFRLSSNAHLISETISSAWRDRRKVRSTSPHTAGAAIVRGGPWSAYNGLAVLGKGGFDKHGSQSKAQGAVCVADAQLPAWSAALQHRMNTSGHVTHSLTLLDNINLFGTFVVFFSRCHISFNPFSLLQLATISQNEHDKPHRTWVDLHHSAVGYMCRWRENCSHRETVAKWKIVRVFLLIDC